VKPQEIRRRSLGRCEQTKKKAIPYGPAGSGRASRLSVGGGHRVCAWGAGVFQFATRRGRVAAIVLLAKKGEAKPQFRSPIDLNFGIPPTKSRGASCHSA